MLTFFVEKLEQKKAIAPHRELCRQREYWTLGFGNRCSGASATLSHLTATFSLRTGSFVDKWNIGPWVSDTAYRGLRLRSATEQLRSDTERLATRTKD